MTSLQGKQPGGLGIVMNVATCRINALAVSLDISIALPFT